jgi:hypothetical protein
LRFNTGSFEIGMRDLRPREDNFWRRNRFQSLHLFFMNNPQLLQLGRRLRQLAFVALMDNRVPSPHQPES